MNVKLRVLTAGVLFFTGHAVFAQKQKKDTISKETKIDEVVVVGYKTVSKKTAVISTAQVKAETINNRPNSNLMNVVQGQLAGVNVTASSGQPGAKPQVIIRGIGTIYGNTDPLYVIDGFPTNSDSFRTLNTNDIESLEVLKDAAALSIYGNRGANGVVVIKTKQGSFGEKTIFNYRSQIGVSMLQNAKYNISDAKQLLTIEKNFGSGMGAGMTMDEINNYNVNTDWNKVFFKPTLLQSHDLSITSGSKNLNSYTNFGYLEQEGVLKSTGLKRFTLRNTLNGKSVDEKFKYTIGTAAGFSRNTSAPSLGTGSVNQNYIIGAYTGAPYLSPSVYQSSQQLFDLYQSSGTLLYTPLFLMDKQRTYGNLLDELRIDINTEASYKLTDDLAARVRLNGQLIGQESSAYQHPISFNSLLYPLANGTAGTESITKSNQFHFNNLWQLEYSKTLGEHTFNVQGAFEYNNSMYKSNSFTQRGLDPRNYVPYTGSGYIVDNDQSDANVPSVSAAQSRIAIVSAFANVDYDFSKKYGIVANIRRDGTSRFGEGYKWGTFWSVGGRWNVDQEEFMKSLTWVSAFKIRGSYGTVGNQRIIDGTVWEGLNPPRYLDSYGVITSPVYAGNQGITMTLGYPALTWETTKQWNVGADFEFLKSRLRGQFDVYSKKSESIYYDWEQSALSGVYSITQNTPINILNKGLELSLAYDIVRSTDWKFTVRGNGSLNKQTVEDLPRIVDASTYLGTNGMAWMVPYVYHYLGVNPNNGNLLFEDINGSPTETPTLADRKPLKYNSDPRYQGGFGFDLNYKGLYLNTTFTFVAGYYRFDYDMAGLYGVDNLGQFNVSSDLLNAWTPTNANSNIPALNASNYSYQDYSDRFLVDASYVRLRNIQLGYRLPKSLLQNTFVKDMSVTLQAENLVTWSKWRGFDAESTRSADQYQYPTPKTFTLGIDVKF